MNQEKIFTRNNDSNDPQVIARRKAAMGSFHQRMASAYRAEGLHDKVREVQKQAAKHGHKIQ
jgi:hypothetical protein